MVYILVISCNFFVQACDLPCGFCSLVAKPFHITRMLAKFQTDGLEVWIPADQEVGFPLNDVGFVVRCGQ